MQRRPILGAVSRNAAGVLGLDMTLIAVNSTLLTRRSAAGILSCQRDLLFGVTKLFPDICVLSFVLPLNFLGDRRQIFRFVTRLEWKRAADHG